MTQQFNGSCGEYYEYIIPPLSFSYFRGSMKEKEEATKGTGKNEKERKETSVM